MIYREYKPSQALAKYIECYWSAYAERPPFRKQESLIPDGTIELMFNFGDPYSQIAKGEVCPVNGSHVIGIRKKTLLISQTRKQDFFAVRFRLNGIYPVFKLPAHLFANGFYNIRDLFPKNLFELEERLYEEPDNQKRVVIVEKYLLKKLDDSDADYGFVSHCTKMLLSGTSASIQDLARYHHTNYKRIERKFLQVSGLTPSEMMKIVRFNKALTMMYSGKYDSFTEIAHACDYTDQSHFIRHFKDLTGFTPKEFISNQFTIVQVIQPALVDRLSKLYNSL